MKEITVKIYEINELSGYAKEKALTHLKEHFLENISHNTIRDFISNKLISKDIICKFYSSVMFKPEDGIVLDGEFNKEALNLDSEILKNVKSIQISQEGNTHSFDSMTINVDSSFPDVRETVKNEIKKFLNLLKKECYEVLKNELRSSNLEKYSSNFLFFSNGNVYSKNLFE